MLLSDMFGVERDTDFEVAGYIGRFIIRERFDGTERLLWRLKDIYVNADLDILYDIIFKAPDNIIHLPRPLTDEQREQLKGVWSLGGRWLTKDRDGDVFAHKTKPIKINDNGAWIAGGEWFNVFKDRAITSLVSESNIEIYDIAKALEVENEQS